MKSQDLKNRLLECLKNPLKIPANKLYILQSNNFYKKILKENNFYQGMSKDEITEWYVFLIAFSHNKYIQHKCKLYDYEISLSSKNEMAKPDIILKNDYAFEITSHTSDIYKYKDGKEFEKSILNNMPKSKIFDNLDKEKILDAEGVMRMRVDAIAKAIEKKMTKKYDYTTSLIIWPGRVFKYGFNWPNLIFGWLFQTYDHLLMRALKKFDSITIIEPVLSRSDMTMYVASNNITPHKSNITSSEKVVDNNYSVVFFLNSESYEEIKKHAFDNFQIFWRHMRKY